MTPACGYTLDYTYQLLDTATATLSSLPSWVTESSKTFTVGLSNDPSTVGSYKVRVTGTVPTAYQSPAFSESLDIDLTVNNDCETDVVTPDSTQADI